jgi:hypothetical protein
MNIEIGGGLLLCGTISAKWAMELGFSQTRQIIFGMGGLLFGPVMPLILYILLLRKATIS